MTKSLRLTAGTFTGSFALGLVKYLRESHLDPSVRAMNIRLFSQGATLVALVLAIGLSSIRPNYIYKHGKVNA